MCRKTARKEPYFRNMANPVAEYLADIPDCQEIGALAATADAFICQIALWDGARRRGNLFIRTHTTDPSEPVMDTQTRLLSSVELLDDTPGVLRPREEIMPVDKIVCEFWRITQS